MKTTRRGSISVGKDLRFWGQLLLILKILEPQGGEGTALDEVWAGEVLWDDWINDGLELCVVV